MDSSISSENIIKDQKEMIEILKTNKTYLLKKIEYMKKYMERKIPYEDIDLEKWDERACYLFIDVFHPEHFEIIENAWDGCCPGCYNEAYKGWWKEVCNYIQSKNTEPFVLDMEDFENKYA